jgi:DNA-binding XRE family transcriptional regulator
MTTTAAPAQALTELQAIRHYLHLSQAQLATRLGVSRSAVARWEAGIHPIPLPVLRLGRIYALSSLPPTAFVLEQVDPASPVVELSPGEHCRWMRADHVACGGRIFRMACQLSRRRRLSAEACEVHLHVAYTAIDERIVVKVKQEQHRQAKLRAMRDRRRTARAGGAVHPAP